MQKALWGFAIIMLLAGIWQLRDVRACRLAADKKIRVFDTDVTMFGSTSLLVAMPPLHLIKPSLAGTN